MMRAKKDNCVYCGSSEYTFITDRLRYEEAGTVVKCTKCNLIRLLGAKDFKSEKFYRKEYAKKHRRIIGKLDEVFSTFLPLQVNRVNKIKKYLKKSDNLLEIGSSIGYVLYVLKKYVKGTWGVELNSQEAKYAREARNINTVSDLSALNQKFDHICLFQLLEHMPDPVSFLQDLKKYLKPGGYIHIEVPNIMDPLVNLYDIPEYRDFFYQKPHLYYFDVDSLKKIIKKARFKIVSMTPFQWASLTNNFNWVYCKKPQVNRADCVQPYLPVNYLKKNKYMKNKIDKFLHTIDVVYKNILLENGYADNIFCTLMKEA